MCGRVFPSDLGLSKHDGWYRDDSNRDYPSCHRRCTLVKCQSFSRRHEKLEHGILIKTNDMRVISGMNPELSEILTRKYRKASDGLKTQTWR